MYSKNLNNNFNRFCEELLIWFLDNKRDFPWRNTIDPYQIFVAEKMLQQTSYGHVLVIYEKFLEKYSNIYQLAEAELHEIEELIKPLGLYRHRSKHLLEIAKLIVEKHNGVFPQDTDDLIALNGVGDYIANALRCFAFDLDEAVVDVNVKKVMGRVCCLNEKSSVIYAFLQDNIPHGRFKEFNWGIIDFSSKVCSRRPKCKNCFARSYCPSTQF